MWDAVPAVWGPEQKGTMAQCGTLPGGRTLLCPKPWAQPAVEPLSRALVLGKAPAWSHVQSPNTGANPRSQQPWNRNPRGLQTEVVQPQVKNATLSSSQILRRSCCQNLYKQITLLSGIQQETEREKSPARALWRHTRNILSNAAISLTSPDIWGIQKKPNRKPLKSFSRCDLWMKYNIQ